MSTKFGTVLLQPDAVRLVESLQPIPLDDIGGKVWTNQHQTLERLNLQAQYCVVQQADEYIVEALIDHEKIQLLIYDLISIELWKEKVYKQVSDLASSHYVKLYLLLYHEAIVLGLLEKAFYHVSAVASGGDMLIELADYCYRKSVYLNAVNSDELQEAGSSAEDILRETELDRLNQQRTRIDFACAISALTIVRFITENTASIPLSVLSRLLVDQDILQTVIPLLDQPPWSRKHKGVIQRYNDGRWSDVASEDLYRVSKTEAQVWLLVNNLLLDREARSKYTWTEHSKNNVMRLSKYLNELLIDQLPILAQLRRFVETLGFAPPPPSSESRAIVIEQVPEVRARMLGTDWPVIAHAFRRQVRILWALVG